MHEIKRCLKLNLTNYKNYILHHPVLLAKSILDGQVNRDSTILVDVQDGQIFLK